MTDSTTLERQRLTQLEDGPHGVYPETIAQRLLSLLDLLVQNRQRLISIGIAGLVISTAIAFLIPSRYEAVARLMPPDQNEGMSATLLGALASKSGDALGSLATEALGLRTTGAVLVGILESRTVQDDLINRFDLRTVYWTKRYEDARKTLARRTGISEDHKSGIITIAVQDRDPDRAAALAKAYVGELNNRVSRLTTSSAHRERVFLEERLQTVKQQLDAATLQLSRFSSKNRTFDPQVQGKAMLEAASNLQGQLIAAEAELSGLEQIYGAENSRVKSASARVAELRTKLRSMSGTESGRTDDSSLSKNSTLYPSLEQLPLLGNTYYDLARAAKIDESVYEVLTKQYELAKVQEAKEIPSIKVLDEPVVPERKAFPPRVTIIVLGTLGFFAIGLAWTIGRAAFDSLGTNDPRRILVERLLVPSSLLNTRTVSRYKLN
jgi:uncharacterized protein involved in exopolysaccharide biosynthesis